MPIRKKGTADCTYCGSKNAMTRDHVFPLAIFNRPYPKDNVVVDSCEECNRMFSKDEELFRTLVAARATFTGEGKRLWKERVVGSSFVRSPKFRLYVSGLMKRTDVYSKGGIYLGAVPALVLGENEMQRVAAIVKKMIKGLYRHHVGQRLPDGISFEWKILKYYDESWDDLFKNLALHTVASGLVKYKYGVAEENKKMSLWGILLYDRIMIVGTTYVEKLLRSWKK